MPLLSSGWRKGLLTLHVVTSVGTVGTVAAFVVVASTAINSTDVVEGRSLYRLAESLTWMLILPLAWLSLLIGVVQSIGTPWGLIRHWWVAFKLVLTIITVVVLMLQLDTIAGLAAAVDPLDPSYDGSRFALVLHSAGGLIVLLVITVLSVVKPRGLTRWGFRALQERAS